MADDIFDLPLLPFTESLLLTVCHELDTRGWWPKQACRLYAKDVGKCTKVDGRGLALLSLVLRNRLLRHEPAGGVGQLLLRQATDQPQQADAFSSDVISHDSSH